MSKYLFPFLLFLVLRLSAQPLTVSPTVLSFGSVSEIETDSLAVMLRNPSSETVHISQLRFYNTYSKPAFYTKMSPFSIAPKDSAKVWVYFHPHHNIVHNSQLLFITDAHSGDVAVNLQGQGTYSLIYYNSTQNLDEETLKTSLKTLLAQGYVNLGYNTARDAMFMVLDNQKTNGQGATVNTLECVYTGRKTTNYVDRSAAQTNGSFNTEHTFPQGFFSSNEPMKSDLHHIFPTDDATNNTRGNLPFGTVAGGTLLLGGSKVNGSLFEPRDWHKGHVARSMMYFVLRYQDYSSFFGPQEAILRQWHTTFAPDTVEIKRNNDIAGYQKNRNPFVDYPQFIERIRSISTTSSALAVYDIDMAEDTIDYGVILPVSGVFPTATYRYVVVNSGNQPLNMTNFALSNAGFQFVNNTGNDTTIAPGDQYAAYITYTPSTVDTITALLTYNTNAANQTAVSVPIILRASETNAVAPMAEIMRSIRVFPNPVQDELRLTFGLEGNFPLQWTLYNTQGSATRSGTIPAHACEGAVPVSGLPSGYYQLELASPTWVFRYPVMKL